MRALGLPTLLHQFSDGARFLQQGDLPGGRVLRAVHPGIVMIAADHPFLGELRAGNSGDHVVDFLHVPIKIHLQMNFRFAGTHVIGNRQPAAPFLRRHRSLQRGQQRLRVAVGNGQVGNLGETRSIFDRQPLGLGRGAHTRESRDRPGLVDGKSRTLPRCTPSEGRMGPCGKTLSTA